MTMVMSHVLYLLSELVSWSCSVLRGIDHPENRNLTELSHALLRPADDYTNKQNEH